MSAAIVHHTVSANDYSRERAPAVVLAICRYHRNGNRWNDIGYNALVDKYGAVYEGRAGGIDRPVVGAHAQGYNSQTTGVATIGTHTATPISPAAMESLAGFVSWKLAVEGVPADGTATLVSQGGRANRYRSGTRVDLQRVAGHRDVDSTSCPGGALYRQLADIRNRVAAISLPVPVVTLVASPSVVQYPGQTALRGRALAPDRQQPLANAEVAIQILGRGGWRTAVRTVTGPDGTFSSAMALRRQRLVRARISPTAGFNRANSAPRAIAVRPVLTARLGRRSRLQDGGRAIVEGAIRPNKPSVIVIVQRRVRGTYQRVRRASVRARRGRYAVAVRLRRPGAYRFRVVFKGDRLHSPVRAADIEARVDAQSGGAGVGRGGNSGGQLIG